MYLLLLSSGDMYFDDGCGVEFVRELVDCGVGSGLNRLELLEQFACYFQCLNRFSSYFERGEERMVDQAEQLPNLLRKQRSTSTTVTVHKNDDVRRGDYFKPEL